MKKLHFTYEMLIQYSAPVARCNFTIKCMPKDSARQQISNVKIEILPDEPYCTGFDGLGNKQIYGVNEDGHTMFRFYTEGDAQTGLSDYEEEAEESQTMIFRHPHGLNQAGEQITAYYRKLREQWEQRAGQDGTNETDDDYAFASYVMHELHRDFDYQPCTTDVDTTAEEAFVQGHGVCQDYAHIFVALMHLAHIPARYVTGLIVGEGASHAWVEIVHLHKWRGLDPTNDCVVGDEHIRIGVGRDAKDCMINRGIMHGGGLHTQTISVSVKEKIRT